MLPHNGFSCVALFASALSILVPSTCADDAYRSEIESFRQRRVADLKAEYGWLSVVVLDFNRATNLPCAYIPFATCPLAPPQNRLGLPITAGELKYAAGARLTENKDHQD